MKNEIVIYEKPLVADEVLPAIDNSFWKLDDMTGKGFISVRTKLRAIGLSEKEIDDLAPYRESFTIDM